MDRREIKQIADLLLKSQKAVWRHAGDETMMFCLHRLYEVSRRLAAVVPITSDKGQRFVLRLMGKKARSLRRKIEERLAVRN